jgi:NAD(P)-dependent dehydrogenase (short-subunit alcohol dehydrogenase family)
MPADTPTGRRMPKDTFSGSTVVITGGGRGLGLGMARRFARSQAHVIITDIDRTAGMDSARALRAEGLAATFEPLDVRDPAQSPALVEKVVAERGAIDVWVNNAGVEYNGPAETLSRKDWDETLTVMVSGTFFCSQAVARHMLERGSGVIVNVASVNAYQAIEGRVAYCTAKAAIVMLTQALGVEWAKRGVRVVGIAPGVVRTELVERIMREGWASEQLYERRTPMHRLGTVDEIAEAVLFLAGDQARYITAETLRVDGGWVAYQLF